MCSGLDGRPASKNFCQIGRGSHFYPGSRQAQPLTELNPAAVPICLYSAKSFSHEPITAKPRAAGVATLTSQASTNLNLIDDYRGVHRAPPANQICRYRQLPVA